MGNNRSSSSRATAVENVVREVADAKGVSPENLTPPLFEAVDPDALDALFNGREEHKDNNSRVTFPYSGYRVTVADEGAVAIEPIVSENPQ